MPYGTIDGTINVQALNAAANVTTTSTTQVSSGLGVTIGANYTGRFLVVATITASHSVADTGVTLLLVRVAGGTIPANGGALTGSQVSQSQVISPTAGGQVAASISILDSPGIGFVSYYLGYFANSAGTATIYGGLASALTTNITAVEI